MMMVYSLYEQQYTCWEQDNPALLERYGRVWMIDVRDSYFQSDPFSFVTPRQQQHDQQRHTATSATAMDRGKSTNGDNRDKNGEVGFHVFTGVESFPIRECGWNSGWIKDCFGAGVLNSVGSKVFACNTVPHMFAFLIHNILRLVVWIGDYLFRRVCWHHDRSVRVFAHNE